MTIPPARPMEKPIGVLASLAAGFDRVATHPALLLPPVLLDLFLWLGPRLQLQGLIRQASSMLAEFARADPTVADQVAVYRTTLADLSVRFNLFAAFSSLPVGVPSMMAGRMPGTTPLGTPSSLEIGSLGVALLVWVLLQGVGLGLGCLYHRSIAGLLAPDLKGGTWGLWGRMLIVGALIYGGLFVGSTALMLIVSIGALVLPLLGIGLFFVATGLASWLVLYLIFTPHGMVRYRLGIGRAMKESMVLVRWNFSGTVRYLALALILTWLADLLWDLPDPDSWAEGLALVGHAIVRATLIVGSYVFYQGRTEWLARLRQSATPLVLA